MVKETEDAKEGETKKFSSWKMFVVTLKLTQ